MNNYALSIPEAKQFLGIGNTKLYQLLKNGSLPAKKIGRRTFILKADLEVFLENLESYPINGGGNE